MRSLRRAAYAAVVLVAAAVLGACTAASEDEGRPFTPEEEAWLSEISQADVAREGLQGGVGVRIDEDGEGSSFGLGYVLEDHVRIDAFEVGCYPDGSIVFSWTAETGQGTTEDDLEVACTGALAVVALTAPLVDVEEIMGMITRQSGSPTVFRLDAVGSDDLGRATQAP